MMSIWQAKKHTCYKITKLVPDGAADVSGKVMTVEGGREEERGGREIPMSAAT